MLTFCSELSVTALFKLPIKIQWSLANITEFYSTETGQVLFAYFMTLSNFSPSLFYKPKVSNIEKYINIFIFKTIVELRWMFTVLILDKERVKISDFKSLFEIKFYFIILICLIVTLSLPLSWFQHFLKTLEFSFVCQWLRNSTKISEVETCT